MNIRSVFKLIFSILLSIFLLCCIRTFLLIKFKRNSSEICTKDESVGYIDADKDKTWEHFKKSLEFETVSFAPGIYNRQELKKFLEYVLQTYSSAFKPSFVNYEIINDLSLLITVEGSKQDLLPYMLAAHFDVVPVVQDEWTYPGFGGNETADGTVVYGRGAIDDKSSLIAIMEALRFMINKGVQPQRGFYIAFGHDEEVAGGDGAGHIAKELVKKGVTELDFVYDEGTPILENIFPGIDKPIAGIGVAEKGSLSLNLTVHSEGGHSSVPSDQSSVGILAAALAKLEANPHPVIFDQLAQSFIESLSLEMPFPLNVVTSNMWLTKPLVARFLNRGLTKSLIRTTTAVTMFHGGVKVNVIPPSAWAIVNHRIHTKQTVEEIVEADRQIINDDRVSITVLPHSYDPHPVSPHDPEKDRPFNIFEKTIHQIYPQAVAAPITFVANTDTRHYLNFTKHVFRMYPFVLNAKTEVMRIHGRDERLSKSNFESALNFYYHLMLNANADWVAEDHSHSSDL